MSSEPNTKNENIRGNSIWWDHKRREGKYHKACLSTLHLDESYIKSLSDWVKSPKGFFVITGPPGCGKTYICHAIMNYVKENFQIPSIRLWTEGDLLSKVRKSIDETYGDYIETMKYLTDDFFLLYDDLGSNPPNPWRVEVTFEFINHRYLSQYPTVITSNLNQAQIKEAYGHRTSSRLFGSSNVILDCSDYIDLRTRGL